MCKQESLIRMLNPVITGWGNYYRYGASTDAFHDCDYHIYNLTKKWALRRHPKKRRTWVADKYWHEIRGRKWTFAWKYETKGKKVRGLVKPRNPYGRWPMPPSRVTVSPFIYLKSGPQS